MKVLSVHLIATEEGVCLLDKKKMVNQTISALNV